MNKEILAKFIERKTGLDIKEITSATLKDTDDEYGCIGEHYIVEFISKYENYFSDNDNETEVEIELFDKKCLVRVDEYERYINSINSIIWLS